MIKLLITSEKVYNKMVIENVAIVLFKIIPKVKAIVWIIINNGNFVKILINIYVKILNNSIFDEVKLYTTIGIDKLSNPKNNPPIINSDNIINNIVNNITNRLAKYLLNNILLLLYGFINNSLIVPLLNSSPINILADIKMIIIINSS